MNTIPGTSPDLARTIIFIGSLFTALAILIVLYLLTSRIVKRSRQRREAYYSTTSQSALNGLLFHDNKLPEASYHFNLAEINRIAGQSTLARQTLTNCIVNLKKSLTGTTGRILDKVYHDLSLHKFSKHKLSSWSWDVRAQGIRELSELNDADVLEMIPKLSNTRRRILKQELLLSTIRLDRTSPLGFLDRWDGEITAWMRIHIHHYLMDLDPRSLPDFSKWFTSPREDFVIFSISMARHFQQVHTAPALARLLSHSNKTIVDSAIRALSGLEAFDAVNDVVSIAGSNWNNEKVCKSIITYLSKTGHSVTHHDLLTQYLAHEMVLVRLEAVRALYQLGDIGKTMLQQHAATRPGEIEPLIEHVAEPLLR